MVLLAAVLLVSAAGAIAVLCGMSAGVVANIYQDGVCLASIDLASVGESYTITVPGAVQNVISVEAGRICVSSATCPDQVCVRQGWITNSVVPVVCLPNRLVIQIENTPGDLDAVAGMG